MIRLYNHEKPAKSNPAPIVLYMSIAFNALIAATALGAWYMIFMVLEGVL